MKMRKERTELQSVQLEAPQHIAQSRANDIHREMGRSRRHWSGNEYIIEWTKRGRRSFKFQFIHQNPQWGLWFCAHTHVVECVKTLTEHWILTSDSPPDQEACRHGRLGLGCSLPHWWCILNVCRSRDPWKRRGGPANPSSDLDKRWVRRAQKDSRGVCPRRKCVWTKTAEVVNPEPRSLENTEDLLPGWQTKEH